MRGEYPLSAGRAASVLVFDMNAPRIKTTLVIADFISAGPSAHSAAVRSGQQNTSKHGEWNMYEYD